MIKKRPFVRYLGSKWRLAKHLIPYIPPHDSYIEPYGGSGAVLLQKERSPMETWNDLSSNLVHLFKMIRERPHELIYAIKFTPWSTAELQLTTEPTDDPIERARRFYFRLWAGFHPMDTNQTFRRQKVFSRGRSGRLSMTPAAKVFMRLDALWQTAERLRGVTIECMDALELIGLYDTPASFFYVDPPYVFGTRSSKRHYEVEAGTLEDHAQIFEVLRDIKGAAIVSGYANELYTETYEYIGWQRVDFLDRRVNGFGDNRRTESIWLCPKTQILLDERKDRQRRENTPLFEYAGIA